MWDNSLYKIYYTNKNEYLKIYNQRFNSENSNVF